MGSFSADWLALREPADRAARSVPVTDAVVGQLPRGDELCVVDLGAGTGANLRYLAPRIHAAQQWRLVDRDATLLARAIEMARPQPLVSIETVEADLAGLDDPTLFDRASLVTASALLDLVSDAWLTTLAQRSADARATVLFALSYDGRIACTPSDRDDVEIATLVNSHQHLDKGFGPALGPDAARRVCEVFAGQGYHVERARSDWNLGPGQAELQGALIDGWARAATEGRPDRAPAIALWRDRRLGHVAAGRSFIVVGHEDAAAWPAGPPAQMMRVMVESITGGSSAWSPSIAPSSQS